MVTPTFARPAEVRELLGNLAEQEILAEEVIVVDGSRPQDDRTERAVEAVGTGLPFPVKYVRAGGGAALQRNVGIDLAGGELVALIDDDVRLDRDFFTAILGAFEGDRTREIGCIAGCLADPRAKVSRLMRLALLRAIGALTTLSPGAYDRQSGHTVPRVPAEPGPGLRPVDVVGGGCAVWRRAVFDEGLRFSPFFRTYFYNEDFHLCLVAGRRWKICELRAARFHHVEASAGRHRPFDRAAHLVINSRFIFVDTMPNRSPAQERRFWVAHSVDLLLRLLVALGSFAGDRWQEVAGHAAGMWRAWRRWPGPGAVSSPWDRSDEV